jgi:hypothetical protein
MPLEPLADLTFNRGPVADPEALAEQTSAVSWLFLCGDEFAAMDGGMSYADVEAAVDVSANVVSDPPRTLDMDLARRQVAALDDLPRPTLVTCRTGGRSSALVYMYEALQSGESADQLMARAESDGAPFVHSPETRAWVEQGLRELPEDSTR